MQPARLLGAAGSVAALAALLWGSALAHAFLDHAEPRVGSSGPAPALVQLWFSERLEPNFNHVTVADATGQQMDLGDSRVDAANPAHMTVHLKPLAIGDYTVTWRAVSVDSHVTTGVYHFQVAR